MSKQRTWFVDHHSVGKHSAPKGEKPISIYKNHRTLAWSMLAIILLSVVAMIYISVTPDDDDEQDDSAAIELSIHLTGEK